MGSAADVLTVALTSSASVMTAAAAIRAWIGSRKGRKTIVKVQVGEKEWAVDLSEMSREEIEKLFDELAEELEPEASEAPQEADELPDTSAGS